MVDTHSSVSDLQQIANLYKQVDNHLETQWEKEQLADNSSSNVNDATNRKRIINDQAYFVLAWGQLEADIQEACRSVIRDGQSHCDPHIRRIWTLYDLNDRRFRFEQQLSLVLERGSMYWSKTLNYYQIRNQVAHGNLRAERIDVSETIEEFFHIQSSLARD